MALFWNFTKPVFQEVWPVIAFLFIYPVFKSTWMFWRQSIYKKSINWTLLELKIPREIRKSPKGMEQVLSGIHSLRNIPGNLMEWYWAGEVTEWNSLEIVSLGGEVHFYVRTRKSRRGLVEAAFLSYYPDIEIIEVEDYTEKMPATVREMDGQGYDLWGSEMVLAKPDAYPIVTYEEFEAPEEERQYDPISQFLEVLGKLKKDETVAIQILIAPADYKWNEEFELLVAKLKDPKFKKEKKISADGQMESVARLIARSPGEVDVLEKVEENLSMPAFDTIIRFLYLSPKTIFSDSYARRGVAGALNQYASIDLNSFRPNNPTSTRTMIWQYPYIFSKIRNLYRKQRLLHAYRNRLWPPKPIMGRILTSYLFNWNFASKPFKMTNRCLATVFHPPTFLVLTAPHIRRVESRKSSPPAGLPIFGDEGSIEKFQ